MQCGLVRRKVTVRLSVCTSVKRVDCDKTEEKYIQIFIPTKEQPSFLRRRMIGGATPSAWNFGLTSPAADPGGVRWVRTAGCGGWKR